MTHYLTPFDLLWNTIEKFTVTIEITVPKLKSGKNSKKRDLDHKGVYCNESKMANIGINIKMEQ